MKKGNKASFVNACYKPSNEKVLAAAKARKSGGRVGGNNSAHSPKEIGAMPGDSAGKHAGKAPRGSVHGKPLMSAAASGSNPKGHKTPGTK